MLRKITQGRRWITTTRVLWVGPAAASAVADIGASGLPFLPVRLLFLGVELVDRLNVIASAMKLDQVILAIDSPCRPRSLILALNSNIMLKLVAAPFTTPGILINGDSDPRIGFRASAVADGDTLSICSALLFVVDVAVTVSWNFLAVARSWNAGSFNRSSCGGGGVVNGAYKARSASHPSHISVNHVSVVIDGQRGLACLTRDGTTSVSILTNASLEFDAKVVILAGTLASLRAIHFSLNKKSRRNK